MLRCLNWSLNRYHKFMKFKCNLKISTFIAFFVIVLTLISCNTANRAIGKINNSEGSYYKIRKSKRAKHSQPILSGKVIDKEYKECIPFAPICLLSDAGVYRKMADSTGHFVFSGEVKPGNNMVLCPVVGYNSLTNDSLMIEADYDIDMIIRLSTEITPDKSLHETL